MPTAMSIVERMVVQDRRFRIAQEFSKDEIGQLLNVATQSL
jgi:hypothetical protein